MSSHNIYKFAQSHQNGHGYPAEPGKHDKWKYREVADDLIIQQFIGIKMSNHQRGMHSRIRPACSYYFNFATQKGRQCLHQTFLHTNPIRLNLPTVIVGSVVSQINKIPLHANSSFLGFSRAKVVILSHLSLYNSHKPVYLENKIIMIH